MHSQISWVLISGYSEEYATPWVLGAVCTLTLSPRFDNLLIGTKVRCLPRNLSMLFIRQMTQTCRVSPKGLCGDVALWLLLEPKMHAPITIILNTWRDLGY